MADRLKMTTTDPNELTERPEPSEEEKREQAESLASDLDLDPDFVEAAGNAPQPTGDKANEVTSTSKKMAEDVAESVKKDERPKKKTKKSKAASKGVPMAEPPKRNSKGSEHDPLQGVEIDPDANYPKILQLIVTSDDDRSMDEFIKDAKDALTSQANAKMATVLLQKVAIDGKHILYHHYEAEVERQRPSEDQ